MALPLEISRTNQNARCRASPESSLARGLFAIRLARPPRAETGINTHTTVFKMAAISCISGVALPARISARRSGKHPVALPGTARNRPHPFHGFRRFPSAKSARRGRGWLDLHRARGRANPASASWNARGACRRDRRARFPSALHLLQRRLASHPSIAPAHEARADHLAPPSHLHRHPGQGRAHAPRCPRLRVRARHEDRRVSAPPPTPIVSRS
jgi:hypothetical protein